jgi:hypothetical protein
VKDENDDLFADSHKILTSGGTTLGKLCIHVRNGIPFTVPWCTLINTSIRSWQACKLVAWKGTLDPLVLHITAHAQVKPTVWCRRLWRPSRVARSTFRSGLVDDVTGTAQITTWAWPSRNRNSVDTNNWHKQEVQMEASNSPDYEDAVPL